MSAKPHSRRSQDFLKVVLPIGLTPSVYQQFNDRRWYKGKLYQEVDGHLINRLIMQLADARGDNPDLELPEPSEELLREGGKIWLTYRPHIASLQFMKTAMEELKHLPPRVRLGYLIGWAVSLDAIVPIRDELEFLEICRDKWGEDKTISVTELLQGMGDRTTDVAIRSWLHTLSRRKLVKVHSMDKHGKGSKPSLTLIGKKMKVSGFEIPSAAREKIREINITLLREMLFQPHSTLVHQEMPIAVTKFNRRLGTIELLQGRPTKPVVDIGELGWVRWVKEFKSICAELPGPEYEVLLRMRDEKGTIVRLFT